MKNFLALATLSLSSVFAYAQSDVFCVDRQLQDGTFSAKFSFGKAGSEVKLFVPSGETSGKFYSSDCTPEEGAIELSLKCNVKTSTKSGYTVRLFSIGGPELTASVTPWSMAGMGRTVTLPCD